MINQFSYPRLVHAYYTMWHEANYRPAAPGDGRGSVFLTDEELVDPTLLQAEAEKYAKEFDAYGNAKVWPIGAPSGRDLCAAVYAIEAARSVMAGERELAKTLLNLAFHELRQPTAFPESKPEVVKPTPKPNVRKPRNNERA